MNEADRCGGGERLFIHSDDQRRGPWPRRRCATDRVVTEIGAACETAGFFYVVDHGVPHDATDAIFVEGRRGIGLSQLSAQHTCARRSPTTGLRAAGVSVG